MGIGDRGLTGPRAAVFLDRDGVLTEPVLDPRSASHESPYRIEDVRLTAGAARAVSDLRGAGWLVVVVSNQPAAAKGNVTLDELGAVHERSAELLAEAGGAPDDWRYCHHHPDGTVDGLAQTCGCRKPAPGMLVAAGAEHGIDLAASWMVGDADSDVAAGRAAGCRTVLVQHPLTAHRRSATDLADVNAGDVAVAVRLICRYRAVA